MDEFIKLGRRARILHSRIYVTPRRGQSKKEVSYFVWLQKKNRTQQKDNWFIFLVWNIPTFQKIQISKIHPTGIPSLLSSPPGTHYPPLSHTPPLHHTFFLCQQTRQQLAHVFPTRPTLPFSLDLSPWAISSVSETNAKPVVGHRIPRMSLNLLFSLSFFF